MKRSIYLLLLTYCSNIYGQEAKLDQLAKRAEIVQAEAELIKSEIEKEEAEKKLLELRKENAITAGDLDKFGFGLGFGLISINESDITSAIVENDVIRITGEEDHKMGFWLTANWIHNFWPKVGLGPFFGVQLGGNNEIVNSIAVGIDFSFKRESKLPLDFQVGYGATRIKTLADGYISNTAPPVGSTQALLKDTTEEGWVFIFSHGI